MALRVLCIDDDVRLFELLARYLVDAGVDLVHASDGRRGLAALEGGVFDAVLLDVMMPGLDGLEVLRRIRARPGAAVPVIMLTAKGDETDRVVGLEIGADDYVPKPFSPRELLARLRAVLRRDDGEAEGTGPGRIRQATIGQWLVDLAAHQVRRTGSDDARETLRLTPTEWRILEILLQRPGQLVGSAQLLTGAWGPGYSQRTNYLRFHMARLRRKLEDNPARPRHLLTEPGMGYRYQPDPESG